MLKPLQTAMRKLCYVSSKSNGAMSIAKKLIAREKPIRVRFLKLIEDSVVWTYYLKDIPLRFEHHFDGVSLDKLMTHDEPEKILWLHLEYMRTNVDLIFDKVSHRRLMAFDDSCRVESFPEFPDW